MADRLARRLRGGIDYPRTLVEFNELFPDETACRRYLERLRWSDGFLCPACGERGPAWQMERGLRLCRQCRKQISLTSGTIFQGTRKPLHHWFLCAWTVTSQKHGASALGVQRVLGLRSYETAWAWLHKLRRAMIRPGRDCLSGNVEVDEAYVGGKEAGVRGRETVSKSIIAIAVELKQGGIGRIRLRRVEDVSAESLVGFVSDVVTPGSRVYTDGWSAYAGISEKGYNHQVTVVSASPDPAHVLMPNAHLVASLIKRWWLGTHQGATSKEHLDYYLDEFTFRFNRRTSKARGLLFYRLLENAVQLAPVSTDALFRGTGRGRRKRARLRRHKATSTQHRKLSG